jgi:hypothetical protein
MAFVISQISDYAAYYLGILVLNLHKGIGRTIFARSTIENHLIED